MIFDYFAGIFSADIEEPDPDLLAKVVPKVTDRMNEHLLKQFTPEDVKKSLLSIGDMKSSGVGWPPCNLFLEVLGYSWRVPDYGGLGSNQQ